MKYFFHLEYRVNIRQRVVTSHSIHKYNTMCSYIDLLLTDVNIYLCCCTGRTSNSLGLTATMWFVACGRFRPIGWYDYLLHTAKCSFRYTREIFLQHFQIDVFVEKNRFQQTSVQKYQLDMKHWELNLHIHDNVLVHIGFSITGNFTIFLCHSLYYSNRMCE